MKLSFFEAGKRVILGQSVRSDGSIHNTKLVVLESISGFLLCCSYNLCRHKAFILRWQNCGTHGIRQGMDRTDYNGVYYFTSRAHNRYQFLAIVNAPNLAAGDVFGSCVFNLFILSILDVLLKKPISSIVRSTHVFAGAWEIILITLSGFSILLSDVLPIIGWISIMTPVIFAVYFLSIWLISNLKLKKFKRPGIRNQLIMMRQDFRKLWCILHLILA